MKLKTLLIAFFILCLCQASPAQDHDVSIGLNAGAGFSRISNINSVVLSEPYFTGYSLTSKWKFRYPHIGGFVQYNLSDPFYLFAELGYADEGGYLKFKNDYQLEYQMDFNYQYINIIPMIGVRFLDFHFAAGLQYGFNVAGNQIYYKSEYSKGYDPAFGTDLEQQQQLRNVLKGKNEFGFTAALGGIISHGFGLEARGHYGTKNVVEVLDNSYNFIPQKAQTFTVELLLTYQLSLSDK